jgi:ABC-type bacteriocin/lantibiotic exporter with double-glycine peptidase domain
MYLYGGILVFQGNTDVASLLVFITYYEKIQQQLNSLVQEIVDLEEVQPVIYKVLDILCMPDKNRVKLKTTGVLEFENVKFSYDQKISIFENMNLRIPSKKHIAIIGKSGCGKSTLVDIALGLVNVDSGNVYINSLDVRDVTEKSRSKAICAVLQEPKFFNLSIRENLEIVKPNLTIEEMEAVCSKVNLLEEIRKLPYNWDTIIGEGGAQLSGGQLQRLAIARVLLINPDIIIFDEATSSLDKENEHIISTNILKSLGDKTYISITHRDFIIFEADIVYVINNQKCLKKVIV